MAKAKENVSGIETVEIPTINHGNNALPTYAHEFDAGCDLRANLPDGEEITIGPGESAIVPIGISTAIPAGYFVMLSPRSGLAAKNQVTLGNCIGVIDSGFRNQYGAILINHGRKAFVVKNGDRVCQAILIKFCQMSFTEVEALPELDSRGMGGFGSTGTE